MESKDWRQRDYLNLISILEDKTGILLSLSTVKRIWKDDYNGNPHPNTLDALAKFLEYEDWLSFERSEKRSLQVEESETIRKKNTKSSYKITLLVISVLPVIVASSWYIYKHLIHQKSVLGIPTEIPFSAVNTQAIGVPNTVIFKFDLADVHADSFFIQKSWNLMEREKISKTDSILTGIYYYPGVHKAKLIANDSVIKETLVTVYSNEWIAIADYENTNHIPIYIPLNSVDGIQELRVKKELLTSRNLNIHNNLYLSYFYVDEFDTISGDDFSLAMNLQVDSIADITCPGIRALIMGTEDIHVVTLGQKGCVHGAYTKFGENIISGKNNDLSSFGTNVYKKQDLNIEIKGKKVKVFLNKENILNTQYTKSIGDIVGFCFTFTGTGQINSVKLKQNSSKRTIYQY